MKKYLYILAIIVLIPFCLGILNVGICGLFGTLSCPVQEPNCAPTTSSLFCNATAIFTWTLLPLIVIDAPTSIALVALIIAIMVIVYYKLVKSRKSLS
jgi:hypothetical protein